MTEADAQYLAVLARPLLANLELVSSAPTQRLGAVVTGGRTWEHSQPPGESHPLWEHFSERLRGAETLPAGLAIIAEMTDALTYARRRPMATVTGETADDLAERIIEDGEDWAPSDVALAMRCTPTFVRRARLAHNRDPESGQLLDKADPWALARELHGRRSLRTIERLTGIPRSTLHDRLR
jgi:hypothetical protein